MKPRNVSASVFAYQQETYVTVTFKLPIAISRDENGIVSRAERFRIEKQIESTVAASDMSSVKGSDEYGKENLNPLWDRVVL